MSDTKDMNWDGLYAAYLPKAHRFLEDISEILDKKTNRKNKSVFDEENANEYSVVVDLGTLLDPNKYEVKFKFSSGIAEEAGYYLFHVEAIKDNNRIYRHISEVTEEHPTQYVYDPEVVQKIWKYVRTKVRNDIVNTIMKTEEK